jgi:hypothetical protein
MTGFRQFLALIGAVALTLPGLANGTEPAAPPAAEDAAARMTKAVDKHVFESVLRLLPPPDSLRLVLVARQYAAALSCEGYEVDQQKFSSVMNDIVATLTPLTEQGQNNLPVDVVMAGYHASLGGQIAVAAYDKDTYCTDAAKLRTGLAGDAEGRVSIWKAEN